MAVCRMNRKQRKELKRQLRSEDPGLDVVHPIRHAMGIFHRRCRRLPGIAFDKVAP